MHRHKEDDINYIQCHVLSDHVHVHVHTGIALLPDEWCTCAHWDCFALRWTFIYSHRHVDTPAHNLSISLMEIIKSLDLGITSSTLMLQV